MKKYFLVSIILALFLSACVSNTPPPTPLKTKEVVKTNSDLELKVKKSYQPDWITDSNIDGYICNVSSSTLQNNLSITKRIATIQVKANISQDIQSYIDTQVELESKCIDDKCKEKFSSKIHITSSQMIKNSKIMNQYTDKDKNLYYVHLCLKI